jgi:hypothetical protein
MKLEKAEKFGKRGSGSSTETPFAAQPDNTGSAAEGGRIVS